MRKATYYIMKKKILVWETLATVSGGQKMTLTVMDMLKDEYDFCCLIPGEGRMSEELCRRGIPYVIIGDQSLPMGVKGKSVIFRYAAMSLRCISRSLGAIRKFKPDILYAPGPAALPWSAVCGTLSRKPVVWHLHHIFQDRMTGKLLDICSKWKSVRRIIAVSECVGSQINSGGNDKVAVLYNPVDADRYSSGNGDAVRCELEGLLRLDEMESKPVFVSQIALVQRTKKQDVTMKAINVLRKSGINAVGIFAGEVREPDYMDELKALTVEYGLEDKTAFLGRREDIPDILAPSDVVVIPSFEGFPLAALEAACAGVPSAVCDSAGALEYVKVSGCGASFAGDNPESAADAVRIILADRDNLGEKGKAFAKKCKMSEYAAKLSSLFCEI